ncbi:hypothetical protein CALVIDRAFT_521555 [Calocera viscosa TUFC12733]|uniref:NACHT domain-containing protein n=1 Tax=Calocera viscosa (strain TUFC12733) TaxID=1330018 RepID=A0A167HD29_CALVF|nr:hypothetical protein CALVIDRAFT_521555 [Calocera viscosa TUFC12733]
MNQASSSASGTSANLMSAAVMASSAPQTGQASSSASGTKGSLLSAIQKLKNGVTWRKDAVLQRMAEAGMQVAGVYDLVHDDRRDHLELADSLAFVTTSVLNDILPVTGTLGAEVSDAVSELQKAVSDVEVALQNRGSYGASSLALRASDSITRLSRKLDQGTLRLTLIRTKALSGELAEMRIKHGGTHGILVPVNLPVVEHPPEPPIFYGRDDLVESMVNLLLADGTCRIPLLGVGGIGKTTIAAAVINDVRVKTKYGKAVFFVRCESLVSEEGICLALAAALGLERENSTRGILLATLRSRGWVLLVLDNLETAWDSDNRIGLEELLSALTGTPGLSLIITMRGAVRPDGVRWTHAVPPVRPLSPTASRDVWMSIAGTTDDKLEELLGLLDGLPLAINLMANRGQVMKPAQLIDTYRHERTSLLSRGKAGRLTSVQVSIELSVNSPSMQSNPDALRLLSLLCLLPDGISITDMQSMLTSMPNSRQAALALLDAALVDGQTPRLTVLSPIRDFVLEKHQPEEPGLTEVRNRFIDLTWHADVVGTSNCTEAVNLLSAQFGNINAVMLHWWKSLPTPDEVKILYQATGRLAWFSYAASYGDCAQLLSAARAAFEAIGDRPGAARCTQTLGEALVSLDRYEEALRMFGEAKTMFSENGDILGVARSIQSMGCLFRKRGDYQPALDALEQARTNFARAKHRKGEAQCIQIMGEVLRSLNRHDEAIKKLDQAKAHFEIIRDRLSAAQCTLSIGDSLGMLNQPENARIKFEQARSNLEIIEERIGDPQITKRKGNVLAALKRNEEAVEKLKEARGMFQLTGDKLGVAQSTQSMGNALGALGNSDGAIVEFKRAKTDFLSMGNRAGAAQCAYSIGILQKSIHPTDALYRFQEARDLFQAIGDERSIVSCDEHMGEIRKSHRKPSTPRALSEADESSARATQRPSIENVMVTRKSFLKRTVGSTFMSARRGSHWHTSD